MIGIDRKWPCYGNVSVEFLDRLEKKGFEGREADSISDRRIYAYTDRLNRFSYKDSISPLSIA